MSSTDLTTTGPIPATRTPGGEPRRPRKPRGGMLLGLVAWIVGFIFVLPVLWMVLTSLHSEEDAATNPPSLLAPLTLDGYREFFGASTGVSPWPPLLNSLTASLLSTGLVLVLAIPGEMIGTITLRSVRIRPAPSSAAASNSSTGMSARNERSIQTAIGRFIEV